MSCELKKFTTHTFATYKRMDFKRSILMFVWIWCLVEIGNTSVWAYESPSSTVQEAIQNGKALFVGRIISTEEVQHTDSATISRAKVKLIRCFWGIQCQQGEELVIQYYSDILVDMIFPVDFLISREMLFVLQNPVNEQEIFFDSDILKGVDFAFDIDVSHIRKHYNKRFLSDAEKLKLSNVYSGLYLEEEEWILRDDLEKMIQDKIRQK